MVEEALPVGRYRQPVFTIPVALRKPFLFDRSLYGDLCRVAESSTRDCLREHAGSFPARKEPVPAMVRLPEDPRGAPAAPHRRRRGRPRAVPKDSWDVSLAIDGKPVQVRKAYGSVYPQVVERTFLGFYADVSSLAPEVAHELELVLPALEPGQFQGLFFENVEPEFTSEVAP